MKSLFSTVVLSALLAACGGSPSEEPAGAEPDAAAKASEEAPQVRFAVVKETVHTERYTFARMDACGDEAWVAGPVSEYEVDQAVKMTGGMGMKEFHSDTLDRTFEKILFVDSWEKSDAPISCGPELDPDKPTQAFRIGRVEEVVDAAGYTYARLNVCGEDVWVAAPVTAVEVGTIGATPVGSEMKGFESSALGRSFESIWFVGWIKKSPKLPPC